jgi:uncharacterized protein (TIGR02466 family)
MNIHGLFPTPFAQIENPYLAHRVRPFIKDILDNPDLKSPYFAYTSTFDPTCSLEQKIDLDPVLLDMKQYLFELGTDFLKQIGYRTDLMDLKCELVFNRMESGDRHQKHLHPGILVSGTFYVDFPQGSSPLILHDPRLHRQMLPYPTDTNEYTQSRYTTELKPGSICLYEGYVEHSVDTNETHGRTIVLFNIIN